MSEELYPVTGKINAEIKADVTSALESVAEMSKSTHKGLCKLGMSLFAPFIASREVKASLIRAQGKVDRDAILNKEMEYRNGKLQPIPTPESQALQIFENFQASDFQRFLEIVKIAAEKIRELPEEEFSDEPIDTTFCNFWRRDAELIDDEKLRQLWADLLVQEVKKSNSVSRRTLDVVKNLTRQEAELFERLCKGVILPFDPHLLVKENDEPLFGTYTELNQLIDVDLISSANSSIRLPPTSLEIISFPYENYTIGLHHNQFRIKCHMLTNAGKEIINILNIERDLETMKVIAREISRQHGNALVEIIPHDSVSKDSYSFNNVIWSSAEDK